jgi:RimJ/RimL family protein N-acetyltransferase
MRLWSRHGTWAIGPEEAYVHYCETSPEARGRGLYPAVLGHIARERSDLAALYIACESENLASRRGIEKAGFAEIAHVTVRVLFGLGFQSVRRV